METRPVQAHGAQPRTLGTDKPATFAHHSVAKADHDKRLSIPQPDLNGSSTNEFNPFTSGPDFNLFNNVQGAISEASATSNIEAFTGNTSYVAAPEASATSNIEAFTGNTSYVAAPEASATSNIEDITGKLVVIVKCVINNDDYILEETNKILCLNTLPDNMAKLNLIVKHGCNMHIQPPVVSAQGPYVHLNEGNPSSTENLSVFDKISIAVEQLREMTSDLFFQHQQLLTAEQISFNNSYKIVYDIKDISYQKILEVERLMNSLTVFIEKPSVESFLALRSCVTTNSTLTRARNALHHQAMESLPLDNPCLLVEIKKNSMSSIIQSIKAIEYLSLLPRETNFFLTVALLKDILCTAYHYIKAEQKIKSKDIILFLQQKPNIEILHSTLDKLESKVLSTKNVFLNLHTMLLSYFILGDLNKTLCCIGKFYDVIQKDHEKLFLPKTKRQDSKLMTYKDDDESIKNHIDHIDKYGICFTNYFKEYGSLISYIVENDPRLSLTHMKALLAMYCFLEHVKQVIDICKLTELNAKQKESRIRSLPDYSKLENDYTCKLKRVIKEMESKIDAFFFTEDTKKDTTKKSIKKSTKNKLQTTSIQTTSNSSAKIDDDPLKLILNDYQNVDQLDNEQINKIIEFILNNPKKICSFEDQQKNNILQFILDNHKQFDDFKDEQQNNINIVQFILYNHANFNSSEKQQKNSIIQFILDNPEKLTTSKKDQKDFFLKYAISNTHILNILNDKQKYALLQIILSNPMGLSNFTDENYIIIFELMLYHAMKESDYPKELNMFQRLATKTTSDFATGLGFYGIVEIVSRKIIRILDSLPEQNQSLNVIPLVEDLMINKNQLLDKELNNKFKRLTEEYYPARINIEQKILPLIDLLDKSFISLLEKLKKQPEKFNFLLEAITHLKTLRDKIQNKIKISDSITNQLISLNQKRRELINQKGFKSNTQKSKFNDAIRKSPKKNNPIQTHFSDFLSTELSKKEVNDILRTTSIFPDIDLE